MTDADREAARERATSRLIALQNERRRQLEAARIKPPEPVAATPTVNTIDTLVDVSGFAYWKILADQRAAAAAAAQRPDDSDDYAPNT